jgi:hypothetical protein
MNQPLVPSGVRDQCAELVIPKDFLCARFLPLGSCFVFSAEMRRKTAAFMNSEQAQTDTRYY